MLRNYLVVAWRNLLKSKGYSLINIAGLAIGLACALAIGLFVRDEFSYDRFHDRADHIYRVVQTQNQHGELYQVASTPAPIAEALKADFPEVVSTCLVRRERSGVLQTGDVTIEVPDMIKANRGFLDVFDFELLRGNAGKLFSDPHHIVITDHVAESLFGHDWQAREDIIGSSITHGKANHLVLAGIIRPAPQNSHLQFDAIISIDPAEDGYPNWMSNNYLTYIELADGADPATLNEKLRTYINRYATKKDGFNPPVFYLQPLTEIYLYSDFDFHTDWTRTSSIVYVRVFLAVGTVVLLIVLFNFINLSTARAMRRAKEVGVRKTIGAYYTQLVAQFLSESLLLTSMAVVLALVLVEISLPVLNGIANKDLTLPLAQPLFLSEVAVFTLIVSVLAGIYPAFYLSNFQPGKVLKGTPGPGTGQRFRQVLVVTQFTLTVILVAATIIIYRQLDYMQKKDLGFEKEELIYLRVEGMEYGDKVLLRDHLRRLSSVRSASMASNSLIDVVSSTSGFDYEGKVDDGGFLITRLNVDPEYVATTGMKIIEGRNFDPARSDSTSFIVNRAAAKRMGWSPAEALGKSFTMMNTAGHIVGVVEDFHYRPMTAAIEPLAIACGASRRYSGILIKSADPKTTITDIETVYKKYESLTPVHYNFVDEELERQYRLQQTTGTLVLFFSCLAVFVACLGLYGLAAFTAERRTKEIGIRKVLGASVRSVSLLLSRGFVSLVILSALIACPIAYQLMATWLESFVYRVELSWTFFAIAGLLALSIAMVTVLYQAVAAARMNPVKSLRSE